MLCIWPIIVFASSSARRLVVIVSLHTYSRWTRWSAYIALILLVLRIDITVTDSMVPSSWLFSEWFQLVTIVIFALVLLQTLGFVDFTHGERNVQFHYWQVEQGYSLNSWMERYLQQHPGQVAGALVNYCYVLWMTWRFYVACHIDVILV